MSVTLGHLVVDAVDPEAAEAFWAETLGGQACGHCFGFGESSAKGGEESRAP